MKRLLSLALLLSLSTGVQAQAPAVNALLSKELADIPGKEALMLTVEYPPGASDQIHRHDAHVFVYVLEGRITMQVEGGEEVTLGAGESFYESPEDVHVTGKNASDTERAKFLVFFVKDVGAPVLVPGR